jgi:adenylosuccinate synthase
MTNLSVVGAQWGDEGKGKVVDLLTQRVDVVVRFAGGANAGHTLIVDGKKIVVHLLPSGVAHPGKLCVLGDGMVVDPAGMLEELAQLDAIGLKPTPESLRLSKRAQLVLPYHRELDRLREKTPSAIGTTCRGIGPAYEDKVARRGLRVCDLQNESRLRNRLGEALEAANQRIVQLGGQALARQEVESQLQRQAEQLLPYVDDTSRFIDRAIEQGKRVLFEGAQGVLLDIDHGSYPFVTSSTTTAGGACGGAGVGPNALGEIIGVSKAYVTRVGEGPFPSEIDGTEADRLREAGAEYGATTGRPRRCGWLDLVALRYARRVSGLRWLALTKLDVLARLPRVRVCVGYRLGDQTLDSLPADPEELAEVEPIFRDFEPLNWDAERQAARSYDALPQQVRRFIEFVEAESGVSVAVVSFGPAREQSLLRPPLDS